MRFESSTTIHIERLSSHNSLAQLTQCQLAIPTEVIQPMEPLLYNPPLFILHQHLARIPHDQQPRRATPLFLNGRTHMFKTRPDDALIWTACSLQYRDR
jgi:hypothetical protein